MAQKSKKISYIRKPISRQSWICLSLSLVGLLLTAVGIGTGIRTRGDIPTGAAAVCFSGFLFSIFGLIYGVASFQEEEKNYILAKIGTAVSAVLVILWLALLLIGLKGR